MRTNFSLLQILSHLLDPLIICISTWGLYGLGHGLGFGPYELIRVFTVYGSFLAFLVFPLFPIYRSWRGESLFSELKVLTAAGVIVLIIFNAIILLLANDQQLELLWPYSMLRLQVFWVWAFCCLLFMGTIRLGGRLVFRLLRGKGLNRKIAVIIGAGDLGRQAASSFEQQSWLGLYIQGFFDDRISKGEKISVNGRQLPVLGPIKDTVDWAMKHKPDMVIITLPMRAEEKINDLVWQLGTQGFSVYLVPDLFAYGLQKARLQQLGEIPVMMFNLFPAWKRLFDIVFSILILIVTSPLFALLSLLIKLSDGGPVFYGHKRVRESGKKFYCYKFRTMHVNADQRLEELLERDSSLRAEWEKSFKLKNDPRITAIGKFLRKTSLDELPQFYNVLKGEMSVVGARPIVDEELLKYYNTTAITYCAMKPGVTGPWQIGKRSDTEDYNERVELDRWYILNTSIWLDLKIIVKTVFKIFNPKGAY